MTGSILWLKNPGDEEIIILTERMLCNLGYA